MADLVTWVDPATTCGHETAGVVCGAHPTNRFLPGLRCVDHEPGVLAGRPPAAPVKPLEPRPRRVSSERYGEATSDPLGREGPGWKVGPYRLPTRDKSSS